MEVKKDFLKAEQLLESVSFLILDYTEGDLLSVSQLIDAVSSLAALFKKNEPEERITTILESLLSTLIKGTEVPDAKNILSDGADLLVKIVSERGGTGAEELPTSLEQEANGFCERNASPTGQRDEAGGTKNRARPQANDSADSQNLIVHSEAFKIFLTEADHKLIAAQDMILTLEREPGNKTIITELFRVFHTIKGESGFLRLSSFEELAHSLENQLDDQDRKVLQLKKIVCFFQANITDWRNDLSAAGGKKSFDIVIGKYTK